MFESIKKKQQNRILRQLNIIGREKCIANLSQIRTIGILFTVGNEQEWNQLYNYVKRWTREGRQVWMAGFQGQKVVTNYIFAHTHSVILREKEDLSLLGIPKEGVLTPFLQNHYDLLIDTTAEPNFFGQYVGALTRADLKATYINDTLPANPMVESIFDLLIHGEQPVTVQEFLPAVTHYLSMIQK